MDGSSKSTASFSDSDVRSLLRLRGEVYEQLDGGLDAREHVLRSLMSLTRASVALEIHSTAPPGGRPTPLSWFDMGWATASDRSRTRDYYMTGPLDEDPLMGWLSSRNFGVSTMSRALAVKTEAWQSTLLFNEVYRPAALGDCIVSARPLSPGEHHLLILKRGSRDPAFSARETALVNLFHGECPEAFGSSTPLPRPELTARERETLALLLSPAAVKEIAARLGLTLHTTNGYVKLIYKKLGVRSRPELMARYHPTHRPLGTSHAARPL